MQADNNGRRPGGRGVRLSVLALALALPAPLVAQTINLANDLKAEADALKERVGSRARPEFDPIGLRLGQALQFPLDLVMGREDSLGEASGDGLVRLKSPTLEGAGLERVEDDEKQGFFDRFDLSRMRLADGWLDDFILKPSLEIGTDFDSNIFRDPDTDSTGRSGRTDGDFITVFKPGLTLESDWEQHKLTLAASTEIGRYADFGKEDYADYTVSMKPRIDIDEDTFLDLSAQYSRNHVSRGAIDQAFQGTDPSVQTSWDLQALWSYKLDPYSVRYTYTYDFTNFRDVDQTDNDFLDRYDHDHVLRLGYEFQPGTVAWIAPAYSQREFRRSRDASGLNRENTGMRLLGGLTYDVSAVTFAEVGAGYFTRDFTDKAIAGVEGFSYDARIVWNPTPTNTFDLTFSRDFSDQNVVGGSGSESSSLSLTAEWDPLPNLVLSGTFSFQDVDFAAAAGSSREDDIYRFALSARYLLSKNIFLEGRYERLITDSSDRDNAFEADVLGINLGFQL